MHVQPDLVAVLDVVDVAEGRQVGGAVPGDGDRPRLARQRVTL